MVQCLKNNRKLVFFIATKIENLKIDYATNPVGVCNTHPGFSWQIASDEKCVKQQSYRIVVHGWINDFMWDSGVVTSDETVGIVYRGAKLDRDTNYYVDLTVTVNGKEYTESTVFRTGLMGWNFPNIQWIRPSVEEEEYRFSPYFRKSFEQEGEIAWATMYITSKGWYELYLNGERPDAKEVMAPATNTEYDKAYLLAYDVTNMIKDGKNTIGVQLGNGYSNQFRYGSAYYGGKRFWAYLSIVYTDGRHFHVWTDDTWKWKESPILFDHIYEGEEYDATLEINGWNLPEYCDDSWKNAVYSPYHETLMGVLVEPVRILGTRPVVNINKIEENKYIYDFKYNGSGVIKIKVKGEKGAKIKMHHAETLNPRGTLELFTNRNALATDIYTLRGDGEEVYAPKFTYHCFRFAEITIEGNAEIISAEALVYGTDMMSKSEFTSSSEMLNRIQQNFIRTLKTNFMSWPCDTGVRDERTPCSMDIMVYEEMTMHNCNAHNYFYKWLDKRIGGGMPDWSGDSVVLAYLMLKYYGDTTLIRNNYDALCSLATGMYNNMINDKFKKAFGDWSAPNPTNLYEDSFSSVEEVCYTMFYLQMNMMIEISEKLGIKDDIPMFTRYAEEAKTAYIEKYYNSATHLFSNGKQTPNLLAISNGIVVGEEADKVLSALIKSIRENDNSHLDTGIFGTRKLIEVLSKTEEGKDLVYDILHQTTYPSFGHQIVAKDATTAWEQWFGLRGMMTCSHSMFCGIGADFFKYFAGIKTCDSMYKNIIIEPQASAKLTAVDCSLETVRGVIDVKWERTGDTYSIDITVPANCTATVILPNCTHEIGSGTYHFN